MAMQQRFPFSDSAPVQAAGARLAKPGTRATPDRMERFLQGLGISPAQYDRWTGGQPLDQFIARNPAWDLRRWQDLISEHRSLITSPRRRPGPLRARRV